MMMETYVMSDLVMNTSGRCFICWNDILRSSELKVKSRHGLESALLTSSVYSIECLSRYLNMDVNRILCEKNAPSINFASGAGPAGRRIFKASLCDECIILNKTFSNSFHKLEKVTMEVQNHLSLIYKKLLKKDEPCKQSQENNTEKPELERTLRIRKDAVRKCSQKLNTSCPQVKLERVTMKEIRRGTTKKLKYNFPEANENRAKFEEGQPREDLLNSSFLFPEEVKKENEISDDLSSDYVESLTIEDQGFSETNGQLCAIPLSSHTTEADQQSFQFGAWGTKLSEIKDNGKVRKGTIAKVRGPRDNPKPPLQSQLGPDVKISQFNSATGRHDCYYCARNFISESACKLHVRSDHLNLRYKCPLCERQFTQHPSYLRHHRDVHLNLKSFKCNICKMTFKRQHHLKEHVQGVHMGQRFQRHYKSSSGSTHYK